MKFCVVGAGGVGGYFGGKLARSGNEVWFIARGPHLRAMKTGGLHIRATDERFVIPSGRMTERASEVGQCDVVLMCVKSYDTEAAAGELAPLLARHSVVISLENGIENEELIRRIIPTATVFGGVAYVYATISAPGEITETGGPRKIVFGPHAPYTAPLSPEEILRSMLNAGINAVVSPDIRSEQWKKFIFISAVAGLTALSRLTLGEILSVEPTRRLLKDAMLETQFIARTKGVMIEEGHIDGAFETLSRFDNPTRSSMYYDLTHHKPLEIEAFSGTIMRYGRELGIATPIHTTLYAALLPHHLRGCRERHHITNNRE